MEDNAFRMAYTKTLKLWNTLRLCTERQSLTGTKLVIWNLKFQIWC